MALAAEGHRRVSGQQPFLGFSIHKAGLATEKIKDYGFAVYNDDVRQDITGVRIKGNSVYITCEKDLSGTVEVTYAGTNEFKGHGNLRDSDDYEAFYTYIDQDKKNSDGSFVFARDKDKDGNYVTLRPNYEPRDKSGNIIYECPYPLYNFSVAFYYKIPQGENKYLVPSLSGTDKTIKNSTLIYQNGNYITIQLPSEETGEATLFNLNGQHLKSVTLNNSRTNFSIKELNKGIYIIKILTKNGYKTQKIQIR